jgi:hypothetical protein
MSERKWQAVRADQLHRYYRPIQPPRVPVLVPKPPEIMPPSRDMAAPHRPPRQEVIPPRAAVRRKRTVKADGVAEEEEDII